MMKFALVVLVGTTVIAIALAWAELHFRGNRSTRLRRRQRSRRRG